MTSFEEKLEDELLPEYRFDYSKARPNRFASKVNIQRLIQLDPDVAEVFTNAEAVNTILRALIATMPKNLQSAVE